MPLREMRAKWQAIWKDAIEIEKSWTKEDRIRWAGKYIVINPKTKAVLGRLKGTFNRSMDGWID